MIKSDSHDSGVENHSQNEQLVKKEELIRARRARRQVLSNPGGTSGDDTRREETNSKSRTRRGSKARSPSHSDQSHLHDPTTVTVEHETKPRRKKKTAKDPDGEEIEMSVRKRSGSRQRSRQPKPSTEGPSESTSRSDHQRNQIVGITIHRTDRLKTDLRLRHPFVRVHVIDNATKYYLRKSEPDRLALRFANGNDHSIDYIPSIDTDPYDFNTYRSTVPSWEQDLLLNEDYSYITTPGHQDIYMFFEIMDFIENQQDRTNHTNSFPFAWAFLKIIGGQNRLNTNKMMRLQLWEPILTMGSSNPMIPNVVQWFTQSRNVKYPSTLYVTVKPQKMPNSFFSGLRSAIASGVEGIRAEYERIQTELPNGHLFDPNPKASSREPLDHDSHLIRPLQYVSRLPAPWQKLPNTRCKIPQESLFSKSAGERGCSSIRFSHNGFFLACAELNKSQENQSISIYQMPEGKLVATFTGHLQMIYELDWSNSDQFIVSASADCSVKIWNFAETAKKPSKTLSHPTYVYCARFHPLDENIVVTAGFDKAIRVWSLEKKHGLILRTINDHLGYISCLAFTVDGTQLASVDSVGAIKLWYGCPHEGGSSKKFFDSWSFHSAIDVPELKNIPINNVSYAPKDHYLLVSARQNMVVLIDLQTKSVARRYTGMFNTQDRICSSFSNCGSFVFSGSEDRQVYCWSTYTGELVYVFDSLNYTKPVLEIQFHPHDNIVAMSSIGPSHQVFVFHKRISDLDNSIKPIQPSNTFMSTPRTFPSRPGSAVLSDTNQKPPKATSTPLDGAGRNFRSPQREQPYSSGPGEFSADESSVPITAKTNATNRRLAVVNKILDDMDELINKKTNRPTDPMSSYRAGDNLPHSSDREFSPYQGKRSTPSSGYNSDNGRPPMVSPLRGLTSPDPFMPLTNRTDDDDDYISEKNPSSSASRSTNQIMYATVNYTGKKNEELSFAKHDALKILKKETNLLWYAENLGTGERGYVSPNRLYANADVSRSGARSKGKSDDLHNSIRDIPRLTTESRRTVHKSVTFDQSD